MLGRTHIALGLMISLIVVSFLGFPLAVGELNTIAIIVAIIGALLPDLDTGTSSLGNKFAIVKAKHIKKIWIIVLVMMFTVTVIFLRDNPILYGIGLIDGELKALSKVHGKKKAMEKMLEDVPSNVSHISICHIEILEEAKKYEKLIQDHFPGAETEICEVGPVIGSHLGPETIGICYVW